MTLQRKTPLRRTGFAKPPRDLTRKVAVPMREPVRAVMCTRDDGKARLLVSVPKAGRFESEAWRRAVASLPCMQCGKEGETQCAHSNHRGKGMAIKADDAMCASLCVACHREIDQGAHLDRAERRQAMDDAILRTVAELARRGLITATKEK